MPGEVDEKTNIQKNDFFFCRRETMEGFLQCGLSAATLFSPEERKDERFTFPRLDYR